VPFSRLVFSANHTPRSEDSSQGFLERWLVIPFERSFRGTDREIPREVLDAQLASERELSGLLNKAIAAWSRLQQSRRFTQTESAIRAGREFQATTDPLAVWLDRFSVDDRESFIVKRVLRTEFSKYLEQRGLRSMRRLLSFCHYEQILRRICRRNPTRSLNLAGTYRADVLNRSGPC
jgi:phage/plasmid-associated DNA primase